MASSILHAPCTAPRLYSILYTIFPLNFQQKRKNVRLCSNTAVWLCLLNATFQSQPAVSQAICNQESFSLEIKTCQRWNTYYILWNITAWSGHECCPWLSNSATNAPALIVEVMRVIWTTHPFDRRRFWKALQWFVQTCHSIRLKRAKKRQLGCFSQVWCSRYMCALTALLM